MVERTRLLGPRELEARNPNLAFAVALFEALAGSGVEHVCICPGSRSAPLATAARSLPGLRTHVLVDERSAAFVGLGIARRSGAPVALVCTSGMAAANFHPAVAEADLSRAPLIVLSADRPPELRGFGAPQTIEQPGLFARHVRYEHDAAVPRPELDVRRYGLSLGARAVHEATGRRPGPVHLNLPFDEPLDPAAQAPSGPPLGERDEARGGRERGPARRSLGIAVPSPDVVADWTEIIGSTSRGAIVCGPLDADADLAEAILELGRAAGWPVFAELTSQLRRGPWAGAGPLVAGFDALLRDPARADAWAPDRVLRFGAPPTSKACNAWLHAHAGAGGARLAVVDASGTRADPGHCVDEWLEVDPELWCRRVADRLSARNAAGRGAADPAWLADIAAADKRVGSAQRDFLDSRPGLQSLGTADVLLQELPAEATLYLANSMSVRDAETVARGAEREVRVVANRGANGIDGLISSGLGASLVAPGPTALLIGDLAFLHDLSALAAAPALGASLTIVVLNDDGGGIFSYLPVAAHGEEVAFDELFRVRHGLALDGASRGLGADAVRVSDADGLRKALRASFEAPGVQVIEVPIDAEENGAEHRALFATLAEAASEADAS